MNRVVWGLFAILLTGGIARAEDAYDEPPINYTQSQPHDPVQQLKQRIASGQAKLEYSPEHGFLESVLRELKIPITSQTLVFSKTSFQRQKISPENPRAIYFNDDTYVGYVPGGDDVEIATTDPAIGTVFYTVDQHAPSATQPSVKTSPSLLVRETDQCLLCHAGSFTHDIPGLVMRSTYPDSDGNPILPAGTFVTTQESDVSERWGGWFVTGIDGPADSANHGMANALFESPDDQSARRAEIVQLKNPFDYLSPRSDAVALMVLAHQTEAHNAFTRCVYATRQALRDEQVMADALGEKIKPGEHSASTLDRVKHAATPLVQYLLFCNEAPMPSGIRTDSPFIAEFVSRGPKDPQGRSLRDLDLKTRLFRYPCSYLIYSASFDQLPSITKDAVYQQLWDVLSGKNTSKDFSHLTAADRQSILQILRATMPQLPAYWRS
jgi:hypothetical protein